MDEGRHTAAAHVSWCPEEGGPARLLLAGKGRGNARPRFTESRAYDHQGNMNYSLPEKLKDLRVSLDAPDLGRIKYDLDQSINECVPYLEQYRHDFETRFALWAGQSRDGRRWQDNVGTAEKIRPWNGAS